MRGIGGLWAALGQPDHLRSCVVSRGGSESDGDAVTPVVESGFFVLWGGWVGWGDLRWGQITAGSFGATHPLVGSFGAGGLIGATHRIWLGCESVALD